MIREQRCQLFLVLLVFAPVILAQDITVNPAFLELKMEDMDISGSFIVTNFKEETQRFRVKAVHWILNKNDQLSEVKPDSNSMVEWMKFNPKEFSIGPKEGRTVRYTIIRPNRKLNGEYWGAIEFEPLEYKLAKTTSNITNQRIATIKVLSVLLVPIFIEVGNIERRGALDGIQIYQDSTNYVIGCLLRNQGNATLRLNGDYSIYNESSQNIVSGNFGPILVLPECEIEQRTRMNGTLPLGNYTIKTFFQDRTNTVTIEGSGEFAIGSIGSPQQRNSFH